MLEASHTAVRSCSLLLVTVLNPLRSYDVSGRWWLLMIVNGPLKSENLTVSVTVYCTVIPLGAEIPTCS